MSQHGNSKEDPLVKELLIRNLEFKEMVKKYGVIENTSSMDSQTIWRLVVEACYEEAQKKVLKSSISRRLVHTLPEDWRAELEALHQRLIDANYPRWRIELSIIRGLLEFLWGYIQIQLENIWLPRGQEVKK